LVILAGGSWIPPLEAQADSTAVVEYEHTPAEIRAAEADAPALADLTAAEELPHRDLGRSESEELLEGVFGQLIEAPAGIFGDFHAEKFLTDNAALVSGTEASDLGGEGAPAAEPGQSYLLESTTPLRTEGPTGQMEPVDLGLEGVLGDLRPANPLIEVEIPAQLGEGITLPETGVKIELEDAPADRSPSTLGETVAFYPNVARDTDFAVSPTPRGVETVTQVRSAEAPRTQTLAVQLPAGAELEETADGGAVAALGATPLITVRPPTAIDAAGNPVAVELTVESDSLQVTISPDADATYPIAVDPYLEDSYNWYWNGYAGWTSALAGSATNAFSAPDYGCSTYCFLRSTAWSGTYEVNAQSYWQYAVPRFFSDYENPEFHERPRSWVQAFNVGLITFATAGDWTPSPGAIFAVSDQAGAWRSASWYPPNLSGSYGVNLLGDHTGKLASFGIFANARTWIANQRYLLTGEAQVVLGDETPPVFGTISSPPEWVNNEEKPFNVSIEDPGLGVRWLEMKKANGESIGATAIANNCIGTVRSPCPRRWRGKQEGHTVHYWPGLLPQGKNNITLQAWDGVGNTSSVTMQLKVDHTAPQLAVSGSLIEQASLGTTLPQYTLKVNAIDGTTEQPQSGVASAEVKVDGVLKKSWAPGCTTQNCALISEFTVNASEYTVGKHKAEVVATDAVGIKSTVKTIEFEIQPDTTAPQLAPSGIFYTAPDGWLEQKTFSYDTTATDPGGYGVKSLTLKIDAKTVRSVSQSCPTGACSKSFGTGSINMASYEGGAHSAELVATDAAGNTGTKAWTINVDPAGSVTNAESVATLEASDETSEALTVASNSEAISEAERAEGYNPELVAEGSSLRSEGNPTEVTYSKDPAEGMTFHTPEGDIQVSPVVQEPTESAVVVEGAASVTSDSQREADEVVRPMYNGVMNFEAIRGSEAPEEFTWKVELGEGQYLRQEVEGTVEVYWEDGTLAMSIVPEPAHDAVGHAVPTSLRMISPDEFSLTVKHHGGSFVYPIVAGPSFSTEYSAWVYVAPHEEPPPTPPKPEPNWEVEGPISIYVHAATPEPTAEGSSIGGVIYYTKIQEWGVDLCAPITCEAYDNHFKSFFRYNNYEAWYGSREPVCEPHASVNYFLNVEECAWVPPNHQRYGNGYHITARTQFEEGENLIVTSWSEHRAAVVRCFGDGNFFVHATSNICNPSRPGC